MSKKRKSNHIVTVLLAVFAVIIIGFFAYSVNFYYSEGFEQNGIVVCDANNLNCKLSVHIHAQTHPSVCGTAVWIPLEKGSLDQQHTHKERNYIHFHDALNYDAATSTILEPERLTLGRFFDNVEVRFTSECLADKCNGDLCGDKAGKLTMTVNGVPNTQYRDYMWTDGDVIAITFE